MKIDPITSQRNTPENYVQIIDKNSEFSHHPSRYSEFQEKCNNLSSNLFRFCYFVANYEHAFAIELAVASMPGRIQTFWTGSRLRSR